jgi:hypothetical protein
MNEARRTGMPYDVRASTGIVPAALHGETESGEKRDDDDEVRRGRMGLKYTKHHIQEAHERKILQ